MMRELDEIFKATEMDEHQWICQKYIEQPMLPHGFKFDIRQWVLVTDWNPLTVWIWKQPYIRFAAVKYDESLEDDDKFMHLVNNSIVKDHPTFYQKNEYLQTRGLMWFRQDFERWLQKTFCPECEDNTPSPPYTCATFGVDFSKLGDKDKKFQEKHEEDDDDEDDDEENKAEDLNFVAGDAESTAA